MTRSYPTRRPGRRLRPARCFVLNRSLGPAARAAALGLLSCCVLFFSGARPAHAGEKLRVVATIPTYGAIAEAIVGDRGTVRSLARGYEDPHFVRPKPSLALALEKADLLISTGLDLELWLPALLDKANNPKVRSGQPGFVSAAAGIRLLDKPKMISRNEGGVHIYGNPHIYTGPLNGKIIARNIMVGLTKVDPAGADTYAGNYRAFRAELDRRLYGEELLKVLGPTVLTKLTLSGKLIPFLEQRDYRGKKLIDMLGGWLARARPLRGKQIVAYHKNWAYFTQVFGLQIVDYVEPKPGIPPSPQHVARVIAKMKEQRIKVLLAGNYYDSGKVKSIAARVGARPVIVGLAVGGEPRIKTFFDQFDVVLGELLAAFKSFPANCGPSRVRHPGATSGGAKRANTRRIQPMSDAAGGVRGRARRRGAILREALKVEG